MEYLPWHLNSALRAWADKFQAIIEVLLVSGLVSSILAVLPVYAIAGQRALMNNAVSTSIFLLLESGISFLLLATLLKLHGERFRDLGLRWNKWRPNVIAGVLLVPFLFLIGAIVGYIFQAYLPQYHKEINPLTEMIHTPQQLGLFIFSALIAGGIKEELQRAFIITRFHRHLGGAGVGLVLWSLAFGAGHYVQGVEGMVVTAILGFLFGLVYIISGNLIAPSIAHGAYNTLVLLGYWFLFKK
jgi:membrane protease YdiL (CAAX protease family)